MPALWALNISYNYFIELPEGIGKLRSLKKLEAYDNNMKKIP